MRITPDRMLGVLGPAPKPAKVWQEQFDYCQEVLVMRARADWDKVDEGDFSYYFLDFAFSDLQPDCSGMFFRRASRIGTTHC